MNQSAISQYLNGRMVLNLERLFDFAHLFDCRLSEISPTLSTKVYRWVDDAERHSLLVIEDVLDPVDLRKLSSTDLRVVEAMVKHLISAKKENPTPGKKVFRPRLVKP